MADGEIEQVHGVLDHPEGEVGLVRAGGIIVLDGPHDAVERLIAGDPAFRAARPVKPTSGTALEALAALAPLMELVGDLDLAGGKGLVGGGLQVFQLDDAGQAMFASGALTQVGDGFFRLFGQGEGGKFIGHGALKPVTMAPQQLATAQLALATVALTAAIKEVQEAVERVEDKVDLLRDILDAERDGEIIGANRSLRRRAQHLGFDSEMSDADWHAIDDIGVAVEQQIERLRSFIRKRLAAAEDEGRKISGRLEAVEHARDVAETLALLVVAQDSLFLFQQMRVLRIKATQPEFVESAVEEARTLLDEHSKEDADLVERLRTLVSERVEIGALEALHFRTASEIARIAPEVNESLAWFSDQRGLPYASFEVPPLPGAADMVDEVKQRGAALASGSRHAFGELTSKVRNRKGDDLPALDAGEEIEALPPGEGVTPPDDSDEPAGKLAKASSSALSRLRRGKPGDKAVEGEHQSEPAESTGEEA